MAIRFIVGASGTGKTEYIYKRMISEAMDKDHGPIILILPEQSNLGAEKDMISYHPNGGTMDISILSFTRLAFQIFDKDNVYTGDILDDYGKSMLVMKVLKEHAEELSYYGNMIGRQGFVDEIKSILSEFYQYQITLDRLDEIINSLSEDSSLYYKLSDIRIIIRGFEEEMGNTYMVAEQMLSLMAEHIDETDILKNASVYFDGFTGFTPVQYEVIGRMMNKCQNLYFTITMDEELFDNNSYDEYGLFKMGKDTVAKLSAIADKNGVVILPHVALSNNYRLNSGGELSHIERSIFRFPIRKFEASDELNVHGINDEEEIIEFGDIEDEVLGIGRKIHSLVRERGYRFRDIAIITGDLEESNEVWKRVMRNLEIPCFIDVNEPLVHNQIVEFISLLFNLFESDFSFDSVFSFLKTGMTGINFSKIYELENYVLRYGVHGYSWWNRAFKGSVKGLNQINKTRQEFMDLLREVYPALSKDSGKTFDYLKALYEFMVKLEYGKKLWRQSIEFEKSGDPRQARVYANAYEKFLMVLDRTNDIVGEQTISRKTLSDMLLTGLADMKLGILPSTLDQVTIGDMERTRLHHVKILFVAGANEGLLPQISGSEGILTDSDRERIKEMKVEISPGSVDRFYIQQYYLYMQMTCASDMLILSYRKCDNKGNALNRSFFVKYITQMFSNKRVVSGSDLTDELLPFSKQDMVSELSKKLSADKFDDPSLYYMLSEIDCEDVSKLTDGYLYMNQPGSLNEAIAKRLYGNSMTHSVSRLETYAACEYQFFLQYGLKLKKPEEYAVRSSNIGTILHSVMQSFFSELNSKGVEYKRDSLRDHNIDEEYVSNKIEELVDKIARDYDETIFESSFRMKNQLRIITRIAKRSVDNLLRHLEMGEMKPEYFEKRFSVKDELEYIHMELEDGITMNMNGIVDRVDIKETEDSIYVKVIDYKSGSKDVDYVEMIEGRQLQLAVYLSVMMEFLKKKYPDKRIVPSGMYYYQLSDKLVEGIDDEAIEKNRIKDSRMTGLANSDDTCLEYMDPKTGEVVPVSYKNGEASGRNSHLVTEAELEAIASFTKDKMIEMGTKIIHGQIDMSPRKGNDSPCNYCDYRSVCRFEVGLGGNNYAVGARCDKEQAKGLILSSTDGDE